MGTAPISDLKSFFPGLNGINDTRSGSIQGAEDFAKVISDAAVRTVPSAGADNSDAVKQAPKSTRPVQRTDSPDAERIQREDPGNGSNAKAAETVDRNDLNTKVSEKLNKIKDAIKDELDVTDEDIEDAMAVLGLMPADLLNADDLKGLMLELSGETDALALITNEELLGSIMDVAELASQMAGELEEEFGISIEDITELFTAAEEEIPVEIVDVNEDEQEEDGVVVEITRNTETDDTVITNGTTAESASLDRKAAQVLNNRKQEDDMQNAMAGQNFSTETPVADNVTQAQPQFTTTYVDPEDILSQVTDRIKLDIGEDQTSMELQLHPASLGTVNLQINSNGGVVSAHILVQNEAVRSALEGQLVQLLQTFEEQGQRVEAIEVSVAGYDLDRSLNQGSDTGSNERKDRSTEGVSRTSRRSINLNELDEEDFEELTEEEQLEAEIMTANGTSVDFKA
ncbi:MAG: flagellar hook-length control protein FliK [Lachnospiraceae bacterium]|nr:flagellar hook-length control protein FliK [Lachnospiraceae bacterium]